MPDPSSHASERPTDEEWSEVEVLQREVLRLRDELIGAEATLGDLRARLRIASERERTKEAAREVSDLDHVMTVNHHLQMQIDEIHTSTTWRIGRLIVRPLSVIRRSPVHAAKS